MNNLVREDALKTIKQTIELLKQKEVDVVELKDLSDQTIHNASVFQDDCSVSVAVLTYAMSKILERDDQCIKGAKLAAMLEKLSQTLISDDEEAFKKAMDNLFSEVEKCDERLKLYVQEVIDKAQIKKGCKLCEQGLSAAQASKVMGLSQWDILGYLGKTKIPDQVESIKDVKSRLSFARKLFQ